MSIEALRAATGFKLDPLQGGPNDDAFLGFIAFAFGPSPEANAICDHFIAEGGLKEVRNRGDCPKVTGEFIDWLIVNYWGEPELATAPTPTAQAATETVAG